jgi:hypothetical membrane protein
MLGSRRQIIASSPKGTTMTQVLSRRLETPSANRAESVRISPAIVAGGLAWIIGTIGYFVTQPVVASAWSPGYSWLHNYISDLGNTACGSFAVPHGTAMYVCSPRHDVMNGAFIVNGALFLVGAVLLRRLWPSHKTARRAGSLLILAGALKILVGLAPENVNVGLHLLGALNVPIVSVAILMFSMSAYRTRAVIAAAGLLLAIVGLVGSTLSVAGQFGSTALYLGLGVGGMERVATYPGNLWVLLVGIAAISAARTTTRNRRIQPLIAV